MNFFFLIFERSPWIYPLCHIGLKSNRDSYFLLSQALKYPLHCLRACRLVILIIPYAIEKYD